MSSQPENSLGHTGAITRIETLEALFYDLENRIQPLSSEYGETAQQLAALTARMDAQPKADDMTVLSQE